MILDELIALFRNIGIASGTSVFPERAPETFCVLTSMYDSDSLHADDEPGFEVCGVRIGFFTKDSWTLRVAQIKQELRKAGFVISDSRYIERESDIKLHHYNIDVEKHYKI